MKKVTVSLLALSVLAGGVLASNAATAAKTNYVQAVNFKFLVYTNGATKAMSGTTKDVLSALNGAYLAYATTNKTIVYTNTSSSNSVAISTNVSGSSYETTYSASVTNFGTTYTTNSSTNTAATLTTNVVITSVVSKGTNAFDTKTAKLVLKNGEFYVYATSKDTTGTDVDAFFSQSDYYKATSTNKGVATKWSTSELAISAPDAAFSTYGFFTKVKGDASKTVTNVTKSISATLHGTITSYGSFTNGVASGSLTVSGGSLQ